MTATRQRRRSPHALVRAALVAFVALGAPQPAAAWWGREHRAVGAESYIAACNRLAVHKDRDAATAQRYAVACGNLNMASLLYGQGTAVSGDWVSEPNELLSASGAIAALRRTNYYRLALTNSAHFHPLATREWRDFHTQAIMQALAASRMQGTEQIEAFEQAFSVSAFGDHFLQDGFAAGHMGFNRPASSASAAKAFHDQWNARGRRVTNRRGESWTTYGDGLLDAPENRESRRRVVAASTESVYGVIAAFVLGERDPEADFAVWREVPFTIENQELLPALESLFGASEILTRPGELPLLAVKRPAVKDSVFGVWSSYTMSFTENDDGNHHPMGALVVGGDLAIPGIDTRVEAGVGLAFEDSFEEPRFAIDAGFVKTIGLTAHGLISHELDLGALIVIGDGIDGVPRLTYRINLEAGDWLLRPEVGPSYDVSAGEFGFFVGFGILRTLSAAGGGGFY